MFSANRSYSSKTSCSRGERSSRGRAGRVEFVSEDSMISLLCDCRWGRGCLNMVRLRWREGVVFWPG